MIQTQPSEYVFYTKLPRYRANIRRYLDFPGLGNYGRKLYKNLNICDFFNNNLIQLICWHSIIFRRCLNVQFKRKSCSGIRCFVRFGRVDVKGLYKARCRHGNHGEASRKAGTACWRNSRRRRKMFGFAVRCNRSGLG